MTADFDMGMLSPDWQEREDDEPTEVASWVDVPGGEVERDYIDTGARSSDRPSWLAARRTGIGASEIAAVLGESRWGDAGTIYARKVAPDEDDEAREWQEWGLRLEPVIAAAYSSPRYAGRRVTLEGRLLRSRAHPWAITTLDAWTGISGDVVPLELKTDRWGTSWDDGPPVEYMLQLQHQMLVTGARRASIAVLVGGSQLAWCDVARDEQTIARIVRAGEQFWRQVEAREMPETRDHDALARVFREHDRGREVELSGAEWISLDVRRCEMSLALAQARAEREALDARIKRAMGRAEVARLDDGTEYRWTTQRDGRRVLRRRETRT